MRSGKRGQLSKGSKLSWKLQPLECVSPEGYRSYPVWTLRGTDWLDGSSFGDRSVPVAPRSGLLAVGAYVRTCSNGSICPHMTIRVECRTDLRKNIFMVFKKTYEKQNKHRSLSYARRVAHRLFVLSTSLFVDRPKC